MSNKTWIPIDKMVVGGKYCCIARNFDNGIWNGKAFEYVRIAHKDMLFGTEDHWDKEAPSGTVKPYVLISKNNPVLDCVEKE